MLLLNICGITGNNMVVQLGLAFLSGRRETQEDYLWSTTQLRSLRIEHNTAEPLSIVTDRELALMKCLVAQFHASRHILCRWHINMNVLAKTKKFVQLKERTESGHAIPSFKHFSAPGIHCWLVQLSRHTTTNWKRWGSVFHYKRWAIAKALGSYGKRSL